MGSAWRITRELSIRLENRYTSSLGRERSLTLLAGFPRHGPGRSVRHATRADKLVENIRKRRHFLFLFLEPTPELPSHPHGRKKPTHPPDNISTARSLALREGALSRTSLLTRPHYMFCQDSSPTLLGPTPENFASPSDPPET